MYILGTIVCTILSLVLMSFIFKQHGSGTQAGYQTLMTELVWTAVMFGLTGGVCYYFTPGGAQWNPPIPIPAKVILWVNILLFFGVIMRVIFTVRPVWKKIIALILGVVCIGVVRVALDALFGVTPTVT